MSDYKTYEELPKRIQYLINDIKSTGYEDIRSFQYPIKFYGENTFGCKIWVDAEDVVKGIIPYRGVIHSKVNDKIINDMFGLKSSSISVHYKNKQQLGQKFLPELKKRLKESSAGEYIHSVRFNINSINDDPEVFVVLTRNKSIECWNVVKNILEQFILEKGYPKLYIRIS